MLNVELSFISFILFFSESLRVSIKIYKKQSINNKMGIEVTVDGIPVLGKDWSVKAKSDFLSQIAPLDIAGRCCAGDFE